MSCNAVIAFFAGVAPGAAAPRGVATFGRTGTYTVRIMQ